MTDLSGQIIGNYRIDTVLGSGGMAQVYRGHHIHLDRPAAIKVMHANMAADSSFQARFRQEARAIAALRHPNIVEVFDFGEQDGRFYLVMEMLPDGSLRNLLQQHSKEGWSLMLGLDLVRQAAEGLSFAHSQGMIHRDVKPDNMLLVRHTEQRYTLKISDFGLARLAEGGVMTATGTTMGTPAYMSPEQCQGIELDARSDLYSLGVVLFEVTTGALPFQAKTLSEAVYKHVHTPPPSPRQLRPDLPPALEMLIMRSLAKDPGERFASLADFARALNATMGHPMLAGGELTVMPTKFYPVASEPPPVKPTVVQSMPSGEPPRPAMPVAMGASTVPRVQIVDQDGLPVQVVELSGDGLTIGRVPENNVQLAVEAISRHHLRVDWDGRRVSVTDLGSSNGSLLDGQRLPANVAQPWGWEQTLRVGPFWLRLLPPVQSADVPTKPIPAMPVPMPAPRPPQGRPGQAASEPASAAQGRAWSPPAGGQPQSGGSPRPGGAAAQSPGQYAPAPDGGYAAPAGFAPRSPAGAERPNRSAARHLLWALPLVVVLAVGGYLLFNSMQVRRPLIQSVSIEPAKPEPGKPATLRWRVANADRLQIASGNVILVDNLDPDDGAYTFSEGFSENTSLIVVAINADGQTEQPIAVALTQPIATGPTPTARGASPTVVPGAPQILAWSVDPISGHAGETITIRWKVSNVDTLELQPYGPLEVVDGSAEGELSLPLKESLTFTLIGSREGQEVRASQSVELIEEPTIAPSATTAPSITPEPELPTATPTPTAPVVTADPPSIVVVNYEVAVPPHEVAEPFAQCPDGTWVVGGGHAGSGGLKMYQSIAQNNGWTLGVENDTESMDFITVYAQCLTNATGTAQQIRSKSINVAGGESSGTLLTCPSGTVLTGGGFSSPFRMYISSMYMENNGWKISVTNGALSENSFQAFAMCYEGKGASSKLVTQQFEAKPGTIARTTLHCPDGALMTAGGYAAAVFANVTSMTVQDNILDVYIGNPTEELMKGSAAGICARF